jgi:hypothetical protein
MTSAYWTFGKVLLAYTLVEFSFDVGEMNRFIQMSQESGVSFCRFPSHPPLALFLFPAALLLIFDPRRLHPFLLFLGGVILYWTVKDLYWFFLTPFSIYEATGRFGFPGFWLGEGGIRVFPRLVAVIFLLGFSIRGLWAVWKEKSRDRDLNAEA